MRSKTTSGLDILASRGCIYQCNFCAYPVLTSVRIHSPEYLTEQMQYMFTDLGTQGFYLVDSSIGNNRKFLGEFCELLIRKNIPNNQ